MNKSLKHISILVLAVSFAVQKTQAQSDTSIQSVRERIESHPIWQDLHEESVDRFFEVYDNGVNVNVSKELLTKYKGVFADTASLGLIGAAVAAVGYFGAYNQGDKGIGGGITGFGLAMPVAAYAVARNSAVNGYQKIANKVKQQLDAYKVHNLYTQKTDVKEFLKEYLLNLALATKLGQKAERSVTYVEQSEDMSDYVKGKIDRKVDDNVDDIVQAVLLLPYNLFHEKETLTIREKIDAMLEVRGKIRDAKVANEEIQKLEKQRDEANQKLEELKKQN